MKSVGEGKLQYAGTTADTNYYNIAQNLAELNARNEEITDRQGNLYGYWCKVSTLSINNDYLVLASVPNTWKVRNAFRKFHFAREQMFRDAGVTKKEMGKYGRTLRPYFNKDMYDGVNAGSPSAPQPLRLWNTQSNAVGDATGGEWTYTMLASSPTLIDDGEDLGDTDIPGVDEWALTILGTHESETTSSDGVKTWDHVAMVQAYNQDRMEEVPDATSATSVVSLNNPLASLRTQTLTTGEILEIAEDQQLEAPPYDVADTGDSNKAVWDYMPVAGTAGATAQHRNWGLYFFPAGLISMTSTEANSNALEVEVIGKELCKDVV